LLEQALACHSRVVALEERDLLSAAAGDLLSTDERMRHLVTMPDRELDPYRERYWQNVRDEGVVPEGKVFVDKLPLNTINLPLLAKLFPEAKVLFAVRDPRDVVLSCFRRHFDVNVATYEMLTLDGTSRLYDGAMSIAEASWQKLPLPVHQIRHEDLVKDFVDRLRAICVFLGLSWEENMAAFSNRAKTLPLRSLSAAQIRRGLNADGVGQWRRYEKNLVPVLPVLEPWVRRFGYD
jgi:hypothetical protein